MSKHALLWFRTDLRLHDNEVLMEANRDASTLLSVYVIDPRDHVEQPPGISKMGPHRAKFQLESLQALRKSLRALGSDLLVLQGRIEDVLKDLAARFHITDLYFQRGVCDEEVRAERRVMRAFDGIDSHGFWSLEMFHPDELPFDIMAIPKVFTSFRKRLEKELSVREPLAAPTQLPSLPEDFSPVFEVGPLETLMRDYPEQVIPGVLDFRGGEDAGLARLQAYSFGESHLRNYKYTRNGLLGANYSSKFSPWLANGCLSARKIHAVVRDYERRVHKNVSTYWLIFELIWRDFFRFTFKKEGNRFFNSGGLSDLQPKFRDDPELFQAWCDGQTGVPFVDANMRELKQTGFMSKRGRQNVASYLAQDLGLDWRHGAAWFEHCLIDYDVHSNWGNWAYVAGYGNDPRRDRYFHILRQAEKYDKKGAYVRHWLPELANLDKQDIQTPWRLPAETLALHGVTLGEQYPETVIENRWQ